VVQNCNQKLINLCCYEIFSESNEKFETEPEPNDNKHVSAHSEAPVQAQVNLSDQPEVMTQD